MKIFPYKIYVSCILLYIFSYSAVFSQTPYFREIANQSNFDNKRINCVLQDPSGFVWVGTESGIYLFDGLHFNPLILSDTLSNNNITAIYKDQAQNIWIGYSNGSILGLSKNDYSIIHSYKVPTQSKIATIEQIDSNTILFGTYGDGVYYLKNDKLYVLNTENGLSDNYIYTLLKVDANLVWAGTDNGINMLDFSNDSVHVNCFTVADGLPDFIIKSIKKDSDGIIWIGMHDKGICTYDPLTAKFTIPESLDDWSFGQVQDIIISNNSIWIATENNGIVELNKDSKKLLNFRNVNNIDLSRINSFMQDQEGNIWLINNSRILISFGPKLTSIKTFDLGSNPDIQALTVDANDCIWFANEAGVFRYNPNTSDYKNQITKFSLGWDQTIQKIMSLYEDPYHYIWMGTFGNGVVRLNPETGEQIRITVNEGLINGNVLSIIGSETNIWFATLGGVSTCKFSPELTDLNFIPQFENFQRKEGLSNNFIYHLCVDKQNKIWFATDGGSVSSYSNKRFHNISEETGFIGKIVYSVTGDYLGNLWMNVAHEGLYKYNGESVVKYFTDPDHANLSFSGIQANLNNELIIAYDEGVDVLNIESGDIIHYEGNAGLEDCNPNLNTTALDSKGNVWIGTSLGIIKYSASQNMHLTKPQSHISEVAVYLEKINHTKVNSFSHNNNHFSFNFAGLWYQYPEKVEYRVKLEGHDIDWINTKNNNIVYSNLKPGDYSFQVKSALYGNFKNADVDTYSFTIQKPFWSFAWFYILVFVILALLVFVYIKYRENKLQKKQEALREKIKFQFENLKSQINPHFLFNSFSTLIALIEIDSEEAVNYVQELSNLFRNILEYKDEDLIPVKTELGVVNNFINLQKKRFGDNLKIDIENLSLFENLFIPPLTLQLLIENAIKHNVVSKHKPLFIQIYSDPEKSCIFVKNNLQEKEKTSTSTGIGISNIVSRYKILTNKNIEIIKSESEFIVGLPFITKP